MACVQAVLPKMLLICSMGALGIRFRDLVADHRASFHAVSNLTTATREEVQSSYVFGTQNCPEDAEDVIPDRSKYAWATFSHRLVDKVEHGSGLSFRPCGYRMDGSVAPQTKKPCIVLRWAKPAGIIEVDQSGTILDGQYGVGTGRYLTSKDVVGQRITKIFVATKECFSQTLKKWITLEVQDIDVSNLTEERTDGEALGKTTYLHVEE